MRLFPVATSLPTTRPRQSLYCVCATPVVERIPLFDTAQCATCWRPFASGAPRPTPQSPEMAPAAHLRRTLASRTRTALEGDRAADGFPRPSAAPDLNTQEA